MNQDGNWYATVNPENKYLYNNKEFNDDWDINLYYYGARWYDPTLGRWTSIDPLAEDYYSYSPYNYVANNPLKFIDPDGMRIKIGKWHQFGFRKRVKGHLKQIAKTSEGKRRINTLKSSTNVHRIVRGNGVKRSNVVPTNSKGSTNPSIANQPSEKKKAMLKGLVSNKNIKHVGTGKGTGSVLTLNEDKSAKGGNTMTTLAHEIQHSVDIEKGVLNSNRMAPIGDDPGRSDGSGVKIAEYRAVQFENHLRAVNNLDLRDTYNEGKEGTRTNLIVPDHDYKKSVPPLKTNYE